MMPPATPISPPPPRRSCSRCAGSTHGEWRKMMRPKIRSEDPSYSPLPACGGGRRALRAAGEGVPHSILLQQSRMEEPLTPTLSPQERGEGAHRHRCEIDYFAATVLTSAERLASSACKVVRVERSAMPSTRAGRKWRWNAVTTSMVGPSYFPLIGTP